MIGIASHLGRTDILTALNISVRGISLLPNNIWRCLFLHIVADSEYYRFTFFGKSNGISFLNFSEFNYFLHFFGWLIEIPLIISCSFSTGLSYCLVEALCILRYEHFVYYIHCKHFLLTAFENSSTSSFLFLSLPIQSSKLKLKMEIRGWARGELGLGNKGTHFCAS